MKPTISSYKITNPTDIVLDKIEQTYVNAFPQGERRDFSVAKRLIKESPFFNVHAVFLNKDYAGFITFWQFEQFIFAEHFAIEPTLRNKGIGAFSMASLQRMVDLPILLEVERPEDELTSRRVAFYERIGFRLDDHDYQQPPYREGEPFIPMRLMVYGGLDVERCFSGIKDTLYTTVYKL